MQGNEALVEGVLAAGVRFFAGYPITPASEICEQMSIRLPKLDGVFMQMEDEIASMSAVVGASIGGMKALTATSGPGFSLKQEAIGYASAAEIPVVIVDVMRVGPASGTATMPTQGDVMQTKWGTHGDHPIIVLSPATAEECYHLGVKACNLSERTRIPVIICSDAVVAHIRERVNLPDSGEITVVNRRMTDKLPQDYLPYAPEEDLVPDFAPANSDYRCHLCSNIHSENGFPADMNPPAAARMVGRLLQKQYAFEDEILTYKNYQTEDAHTLLIAYGCTARAAYAAVDILRGEGIKAGVLQLQSLWPFPEKLVKKYCAAAKRIIMPELNEGQLIREARLASGREIEGMNRFDGATFSPREIAAYVRGGV